MPKRKRVQREHTEDWQTIQQYTLWPEQTAYELLRPVVLFGDPAIQRAQETGEPRTSLERKADTFDEQGMVSFYTSTLKIEYQETELAFYTLEWEDNKHIKEVKNPRLIETGYRSPQLTLWTLGPDEWLLFLKLPDYAARKKPKGAPDVIQLPLPDLDENQRQQVSS